MRLRSVELQVEDVAAAAGFLEKTWGLAAAGTEGKARLFRGTADLPHLLALSEGTPALLSITFCGPEVAAPRTVEGPEGQRYRFVPETKTAPLPAHRDQPVQLSHVVLNCADVDAAERFANEKLGFRTSDRTAHMTFVRCNRTHHCIAFARGGYSSLNHIAFEMRDLDGVMRGIGRLRDAGYECTWGPGRHGPGNNVFGYFVAPFGANIEYTSEVEQVGDDYRVGSPADWKWPPGRIDQWGLSQRGAAMGEAEKRFRWAA
jgi:catechol 2,3-dioxygenase-like lactoylglutathione lyase family enzyme